MPQNISYDNLKDCFYFLLLHEINAVKPKGDISVDKKIFSKKSLVVLIQYAMVTIGFLRVWTQPHISTIILDSLYKEHSSVQVKMTRYL